jgi:homoserine kinase type II
MGETLARMHKAGQGFAMTRENSMNIAEWTRLIGASSAKADTVEPGLTALLRDELAALAAGMPRGLPRGAVHADVFPDNVFFKGDKLSGVIDFYFACTDTLAYDLMLTLNAWCFDKSGAPDRAKSAAMLDAYHRLRALDAEEIKSLPYFGRAAAVRIVATRLYDWLNPKKDALVTPKDPLEHVSILRFHRKAQGPADYGFAP